jgi:phage terminase large subunit GpA-like protein
MSLARLVKKFLKGKDKPGQLRVFTNTVLAETWEESGAKVDDDALVRRAERSLYAGGEVPAGVLLLIASVDVQGDRLEVEVRGWGRGYENWQIQHTVLAGDPGRPELWEELDQLLASTWQTDDGRLLPLRAAGIDSGGHHTELVLRFCRPRWGRRIWALKGDSKGLYNRVWPLKFSHSRKSRDRFWNINVDAAKKAVTDWLKIEEPGPGFCHFPKGTAPEFFKQYEAESLVTRFKRGFPVRVWALGSGRRNEALDLFGYNYAVLCGLEAMGLNLNREARRAGQSTPEPRPTTTMPAAPPPPSSGGAAYGSTHAGVTLPADPYL